jgi:hypothetical protein
VSIDSSSDESPSSTTPSAGTISHGKLFERHVDERAVGSLAMRLRRHELGERLERFGGLAHGAHLDPMAKQHDIDESREFPEERHPLDAEHGRGAVRVRDADRDCHERHHARLAVAQLSAKALEERHATVDVEHRGEREKDPVGPRHHKKTPAFHEWEGGRDRDHWNGEREAHPEAATEVGYRVALVLLHT